MMVSRTGPPSLSHFTLRIDPRFLEEGTRQCQMLREEVRTRENAELFITPITRPTCGGHNSHLLIVTQNSQLGGNGSLPLWGRQPDPYPARSNFSFNPSPGRYHHIQQKQADTGPRHFTEALAPPSQTNLVRPEGSGKS